MEKTLRTMRGMTHWLRPDPRKVRTPEALARHLQNFAGALEVIHGELVAPEPENMHVAEETTPEPETPEESEPKKRKKRGGRDRQETGGTDRGEDS